MNELPAVQRLRVGSVQFGMRPTSVETLLARVDGFAREARDWGCRLLVLPEYISGCLVPALTNTDPRATFMNLSAACLEFQAGLRDLSAARNLWLLGGTVIEREGQRFFNTAPLISPDGSVWMQRKIHLTPWEKQSQLISAGGELIVVETPFGRLASIICYDMEFADLVRSACDAGADILLNPSCTDNRHGFWRVRYSAHARCIENQVFTVSSCTTGWFPETPWLASNHGRAAIIGPCDVPFARDGIIAEGEMDICDQMIYADLPLEELRLARQGGAVTPRQDRRSDYKIVTSR